MSTINKLIHIIRCAAWGGASGHAGTLFTSINPVQGVIHGIALGAIASMWSQIFPLYAFFDKNIDNFAERFALLNLPIVVGIIVIKPLMIQAAAITFIFGISLSLYDRKNYQDDRKDDQTSWSDSTKNVFRIYTAATLLISSLTVAASIAGIYTPYAIAKATFSTTVGGACLLVANCISVVLENIDKLTAPQGELDRLAFSLFGPPRG